MWSNAGYSTDMLQWIRYVVVLSFTIHTAVSEAVGYQRHSGRLYRDLFDEYVPVRPGLDQNSTVYVNISLNLYQVKNLDGKWQHLETTGQLLMIWSDPSLSWNPAEYGGIHITESDAAKIWTPVIGLRNSAGHVVDSDWKVNFPVSILFDGTLAWGPIGSFISTCDLDMYKFPFDTQHCCLDFGNLVHNDGMVNLTPATDEVNFDFFLESKEFRVTSKSVEYSRHPFVGAFKVPVISFCLTLERLPAYYLLSIVIPVAVLAFLSAFTFYVPMESGEKLSLAMTILLSFSVFLLLLSETTPQTSWPLPFIACYLTVTVALSALSMMIQMMTLNMYHGTHLVRPVPLSLKRFTNAIQSCLRCCHLMPDDATSPVINTPSVQEETRGDCVENGQPEDIRERPENEALLNEVIKITDVIADDAKAEALKLEWRIVAETLDRFLFIVFGIIQMLMILIAFVIVPSV